MSFESSSMYTTKDLWRLNVTRLQRTLARSHMDMYIRISINVLEYIYRLYVCVCVKCTHIYSMQAMASRRASLGSRIS